VAQAGQHAEHRAIDGGRVTVAGPIDVTTPVTSTARYRFGDLVRELTTAPRDAIDALPIVVDEEYAHRGGTLRIGHRDERDDTVHTGRRDITAAWQGQQFALVVTETAPDGDGLIALVDSLTLEEHTDGLVVGSDAPMVDAPRLTKELPGVGLAEITPLVPSVTRGLPRWSGTATVGGDLYRDTARGDAPILILVGDSAATTLLLDPGTDAEADRATDLAAELVVTWDAAG
jgi:hypothetical protein